MVLRITRVSRPPGKGCCGVRVHADALMRYRGSESNFIGTTAEYQQIASIIQGDLQAAIMILNEINGRSGQTTSVEMDRLIGLRGASWAYDLTASGGQQRVAILYDQQRARRDACFEIGVLMRS